MMERQDMEIGHTCANYVSSKMELVWELEKDTSSKRSLLMNQIYQELLEGEIEFLWHLEECQRKSVDDYFEYSFKVVEQKKLIEQTKKEASEH